MKVLVKKWGNSASVRIPAPVMEAARFHLDQPVDVRAEDGRVVIEPVQPQGYELADLVAGITADNRHEPADFGPPLGNEAW